jgi:hypothetical protein
MQDYRSSSLMFDYDVNRLTRNLTLKVGPALDLSVILPGTGFSFDDHAWRVCSREQDLKACPSEALEHAARFRFPI